MIKQGLNLPNIGRFKISLCVLSLSILALLLRFLDLGNPFQSSDNSKLAVKILLNPGYLWMINEKYGILINLLIKIFTGTVSLLGIGVTELSWKAPVALIGTLQVPMTYAYLKKWGCSKTAALMGAAFTAVLPIHIMQSRYLWGYEVLGAFFIIPAIWSLADFFNAPGAWKGLKASLLTGIYLLSHGYIIAFLPCLLLTAVLFHDKIKESVILRISGAMNVLFKGFIWVFPLLFFPLYVSSLIHTFHKQARPGIFLEYHMNGFIQNTGILLACFLLVSVLLTVFYKTRRLRQSVLLAGCGIIYLLPLFFGAPPGITEARGYMLIGTYFLVLCAAFVLDNLLIKNRAAALCLFAGCFLMTLWGSINAVFFKSRFFDISAVKIERGGTEEYGIKAAAYIVRKYVPDSANVLAIHRSIEPPNFFYYFGRKKYSRYDLSPNTAYNYFLRMRNSADVVIAGGHELAFLKNDKKFTKKTVIYNRNHPLMWIYAVDNIRIPGINTQVSDLNRAFDREYSRRVSLK